MTGIHYFQTINKSFVSNARFFIMRLHQVNQLSYSADLERTWQNSLNEGDQVLLIEEAILRTVQTPKILEQLSQTKKLRVFYLHSDAVTYGVSPKIGKALSDEEWVDLTFAATSNISW